MVSIILCRYPMPVLNFTISTKSTPAQPNLIWQFLVADDLVIRKSSHPTPNTTPNSPFDIIGCYPAGVATLKYDRLVREIEQLEPVGPV